MAYKEAHFYLAYGDSILPMSKSSVAKMRRIMNFPDAKNVPKSQWEFPLKDHDPSINRAVKAAEAKLKTAEIRYKVCRRWGDTLFVVLEDSDWGQLGQFRKFRYNSIHFAFASREDMIRAKLLL